MFQEETIPDSTQKFIAQPLRCDGQWISEITISFFKKNIWTSVHSTSLKFIVFSLTFDYHKIIWLTLLLVAHYSQVEFQLRITVELEW